MIDTELSKWSYRWIETGRKLQGGVRETAYQIYNKNKEFDVIATVDAESSKAKDVARLLTAAPEMLKALRIANKFCGSLTSDVCSDSVHIPIRDAIFKATGEQV